MVSLKLFNESSLVPYPWIKMAVIIQIQNNHVPPNLTTTNIAFSTSPVYTQIHNTPINTIENQLVAHSNEEGIDSIITRSVVEVDDGVFSGGTGYNDEFSSTRHIWLVIK
jgi:hypothetical protein